MKKKFRAAIYTLGCRTNQYESDAIAKRLCEAGFEICDFSEAADVYVVNTCSVTAEADRKSRQLIRRGMSKNPDAVTIVTGCFAQLDPEAAAALGADLVCGNRNKLDAAEYAIAAMKEKQAAKIAVPEIDTMPIEEMSAAIGGKTRAFLKIEDGCDNHCAYCIIREARGRVVSRETGDILCEAKEMTAAGVKEIVITGTEIASYGRDGGKYTLCDAISAVCESGVGRVRIGSIEPSVLKPELIDRLCGLGAFLPSIHLSLQSGSDAILAAMRRKYNSQQVLENVRYIREKLPDAEFSADVIVGFPGETEEDFAETCRVAREAELYHMHIFPYSDRRGTESASMQGKLSAAVKSDRLARLSELGEELAAKVYGRYLGESRTLEVLFEERVGNYYVGHAQNMLEVKVETDEELAGRVFACKPVEYVGGAMLCSLGEEKK